jgi:hypothetical protein
MEFLFENGYTRGWPVVWGWFAPKMCVFEHSRSFSTPWQKPPYPDKAIFVIPTRVLVSLLIIC